MSYRSSGSCSSRSSSAQGRDAHRRSFVPVFLLCVCWEGGVGGCVIFFFGGRVGFVYSSCLFWCFSFAEEFFLIL